MKDIKDLQCRKDEDEFQYGEVSIQDLWDTAYANVKDDLKFKTEEQEKSLANFRNATNPTAQTELIFRDWRHPSQAATPEEQRKEQNLRDNVKSCMTWFQDAFVYAQNHASGTFAEPVQIIAGGLEYALQAAKDVSDDLDAVQTTFETIAAAMSRLHSMDKFPVASPQAKKHLVGVIVSLLLFCSYVGSDLREQSRWKLWRNKIFKYHADVIQEECGKVEQAVNKFHDAIRDESYQDTKEIKEGVHWLIQNINTKMHQASFTGGIYNQSEKGNVLDKIARSLQRHFHVNPTVMSQMATRMDTATERQVPGVFDWFRKEREYLRWLHQPGKDHFLYIKGNDGAGKTFLTAHCYDLIPRMAERNHTLVQKDSVRQQLVVTYFLFEPGMQHFQNFPSVIATILFQIAAQDPKWCDAISTRPELSNGDPEEIWNELILKRFDKKARSSEKLYILLDGITEMQPKERELMSRLLYNTLKDGQYCIWIILTGSRQPEDTFPTGTFTQSTPVIEMGGQKNRDAITKIFAQRRGVYEHLSRLRPEQEKYILVCEYLERSSKGNLSLLDPMLEMLDQEVSDLKTLTDFISKEHHRDERLFQNLFRGDPEANPHRRAMKKVFWWCAFAKCKLTVHDLEGILQLDDDVKDIRTEDVLRGCKDLLYIQSMLTRNLGPESIDPDLYWCSQPDYSIERPITSAHAASVSPQYEYLEFRQRAFKEHVQNGDAMFDDVVTAKVDIFVTLCDVLCDSNTTGVESLRDYAAFHIISHLRDIDFTIKEHEPEEKALEDKIHDKLSDRFHDKIPDKIRKDKGAKDKEPNVKDTKFRAPRPIPAHELNRVGQALFRLLATETDAPSVFERVQARMADGKVDFELYELPEWPDPKQNSREGNIFTRSTRTLIQNWATQLYSRGKAEKQIAPQICDWARNIIEQPQQMLKLLADSHLRNWSQKTTVEEARVSYKLAYRAFCTTDLFMHWSRENDQINGTIAVDMLSICRGSRSMFAQARLAAGFLLYESPNEQDRKHGLTLFDKNRHLDDSMCAERFYSLLGLAQHYYPHSRRLSGAIPNWNKVKEYTGEALQCLTDSGVSLRPNLNSEKCRIVYKLHAKALEALGDITDAIDTCQKALGNSFLQKCPAMDYFLTILVRVYSDQQDYSKVIEVVREELARQPPHFMPAWLMNRSQHTNKNDRLRRAAAVTGNMDLAIQLYDEAIRYWGRAGLFHETFVMLYELAIIYRRDCQVTKMAEDILNRLLRAVTTDNSFHADSALLSMIILERFDIFFERYSKTHDPEAKRSMCKIAGKLINNPRVADVVESSARTCALVTLAKMHRGIGEERAAYRHANDAFNLCISDLEDWVDENDMGAFRALSKVLHFAGLEKDAGIAASLIFDRANAIPEGVSEQEYRDTLSSVFDVKGESHSPSGVQTIASDDVAFSPGLLTDMESNASSSLKGDYATTNATTPCSSPTKETVDEGTGGGILCEGPCGKKILSGWDLKSPPWYVCLDCPSTDYCQECYDSHGPPHARSMDKGFWSKICWGKHDFIAQPIAGWKGVIGGVIHVHNSKRGVQDWLMDTRIRWRVRMEDMNRTSESLAMKGVSYVIS